MNIFFRSMIKDDIDKILDIEKKAFPDPWTREMFYSELLVEGSVFQTACIKNNDEEIIVGYAGCRYFESCAEILNLAVDAQYRLKGIGKKILSRILDILNEKGVKNVFLEVRESNTAAKKLYGDMGFSIINVRKKYYSNPEEDALILKK
ncbi:MAG: ribosomal protein S18-alanine N-acetyltransferase [Elusimicrobiota bacterium]